MTQVHLSRVTVRDAPDLIRANQESRDYHHPWAQPFRDEAGFKVWFGRMLAGPNIGLIARDVVSADVVGVVNLNEIVAGGFQSAYLGYYGMVRHAGRGMMTESLRLAVQLAFTDLGLHRLEANIQPANVRSIALVRRLGFKREGFSERYLLIDGVWRGHERWALVADEPG